MVLGRGYYFYCTKCKEEHFFYVGVGMLFPMVYKKTVENIKSGKYGKEWKSFFEKYPNGMINAYKEVYYCPKCHLAKSQLNLSFYKPLDPNEPEVTDVSYQLDFSKYSLVKEYTHICRQCDQNMRNAARNIWLMPVNCPKCGERMTYGGKLLWD